ncbi:MAG: hypothetical protein Q9191_007903, partial [Dirinaria sp. TL-2023a]
AVVAECFPVRVHPSTIGAIDPVGRVVGQVFVAVGTESPLAWTKVAEERAESGHTARNEGEVMLDAASQKR